MKFALKSGLPKSFVFIGGSTKRQSRVKKRYTQPQCQYHALSYPMSQSVVLQKIKRIFTPHPEGIFGTFLERLPHLAGGEVARSGEAVEEHALDVDVAAVQRAPELQQDIFAGAREVNMLVS